MLEKMPEKSYFALHPPGREFSEERAIELVLGGLTSYLQAAIEPVATVPSRSVQEYMGSLHGAELFEGDILHISSELAAQGGTRIESVNNGIINLAA